MQRVKPYPCTGCGLCCKHVTGYLPAHPSGTCMFLHESKCTIYDDRPTICRVDTMIDKHEDSQKRYEDNVKACNLLQEMYGLGTEYRVR